MYNSLLHPLLDACCDTLVLLLTQTLCLCLSSYREVGAVMVEVLGRFDWRIVGMVN